MSKSIFDKSTRNELEQRIDKISLSSPAQWGQMNAAEMLYHCKQALRIIMHAEEKHRSSTIRQKLLKFVFLYVKNDFPKNVRTPKQIDVKKSKVIITDIELEKRELKEVMELFSMQQNLHAAHPYFGNLNRKGWGIFSYKHIDHHLKQFGV